MDFQGQICAPCMLVSTLALELTQFPRTAKSHGQHHELRSGESSCEAARPSWKRGFPSSLGLRNPMDNTTSREAASRAAKQRDRTGSMPEPTQGFGKVRGSVMGWWWWLIQSYTCPSITIFVGSIEVREKFLGEKLKIKCTQSVQKIATFFIEMIKFWSFFHTFEIIFGGKWRGGGNICFENVMYKMALPLTMGTLLLVVQY